MGLLSVVRRPTLLEVPSVAPTCPHPSTRLYLINLLFRDLNQLSYSETGS